MNIDDFIDRLNTKCIEFYVRDGCYYTLKDVEWIAKEVKSEMGNDVH